MQLRNDESKHYLLVCSHLYVLALHHISHMTYIKHHYLSINQNSLCTKRASRLYQS